MDKDKSLPESKAIYDGITSGSLGDASMSDLKNGFSDQTIRPKSHFDMMMEGFENENTERTEGEESKEAKVGFTGRPSGWER